MKRLKRVKNCKSHEKLSLIVSVSRNFTKEISSFQIVRFYFQCILCATDKLLTTLKGYGNAPSTLMRILAMDISRFKGAQESCWCLWVHFHEFLRTIVLIIVRWPSIGLAPSPSGKSWICHSWNLLHDIGMFYSQ